MRSSKAPAPKMLVEVSPRSLRKARLATLATNAQPTIIFFFFDGRCLMRADLMTATLSVSVGMFYFSHSILYVSPGVVCVSPDVVCVSPDVYCVSPDVVCVS